MTRFAVLDWGVGGAGSFRLLKERLPDASVVYWSDSGFTPYGKVPRTQLVTRVTRVFAALAEHEVTHVIVACNAASTVLDAVPSSRRSGLEVTGVIEPTIAALQGGGRRHLGVVGGARTIRSGVYGRGLRGLGHTVTQRVAQPLSAMVEAGDLTSPKAQAAVTRVVQPLAAVDGLVLACTHYPALAPLFQAALPEARLIDPAVLTWDYVRRAWRRALTEASQGPRGHDRVLTTGSAAATRTAAHRAFGVRWTNVETTRLK